MPIVSTLTMNGLRVALFVAQLEGVQRTVRSPRPRLMRSHLGILTPNKKSKVS